MAADLDWVFQISDAKRIEIAGAVRQNWKNHRIAA